MTSLLDASGVDAWTRIETSLNARGYATLKNLLTSDECAALSALYPRDNLFRSRIVMARHGFGRGEYKYFAYPLPDVLAALRAELYARLAPVANRWNQMMGVALAYPAQLPEFLARCHEAGQTRPTALMLKYGAGDYNCLHQDVYGEHVFPLRVAILLSEPERDFSGGQFVMTEKIASQQNAHVIPLGRGDAVIFTVNQRPIFARGAARKAAMRHGVSQILRGERYTAGLIFHDAA